MISSQIDLFSSQFFGNQYHEEYALHQKAKPIHPRSEVFRLQFKIRMMIGQ